MIAAPQRGLIAIGKSRSKTHMGREIHTPGTVKPGSPPAKPGVYLAANYHPHFFSSLKTWRAFSPNILSFVFD
jgi:hypothetical protein